MNSGSTRLYNVLAGNPVSDFKLNNSIGRSTRTAASSDDNFFTKRLKSLENAFGTVGAAIASIGKDAAENKATENMLADNKTRMNNIAKKYGYNTYHDVWDARDKAVEEGDQATIDRIDNVINPELKAQANENSERANKKAADYKDYRENNYVSKKINQDRGKFAGSAINTLSTGFDIASLLAGVPNGPVVNAVQGGIEGLADELEQNGFENFDAGRAGQNALIGATAGAATGSLNKAIGGKNLIPGGNKVSNVLNKALNTGVARGGISGAVGGATGAGLGAAMNGQDVLGSAIEGAKQGALQGAIAGGVMSGANKAINKFAPNTAQKLQANSQAWENWKNSGNTFDERLTNTLTSGDSAVGDWLTRKTQSNFLSNAGNIGNRIETIDTPRTTTGDAWDRLAQQNGYQSYDDVIRSYMESNPGVELNPNGAAGQILTWLDENPNTPTTAAGWAKRAGQRVLEDVNNSNVGMRVKDVSNDLPDDIRNLAINDNTQIPDTRGQFDDVIEYARNNDLGKYGRNEIREIYESGDTNAIRNLENAWRENGLSDVIDAARDEFLNKPTVQTSTPQNVPQTQEEVIDLTKSFDNPGLEGITNRNKLQAVGKQLQNAAQTQKYSGIYDALDPKTAERVAKTNAPQKLADLGVKSQDYNEYAKTSSYVNEVASDLAKRSKIKINDPDLPTKLSPENIDVVLSDAALRKYNDYIKKIVPDGDAPGQYSASYLLEKSRELGNKAANLRGNTDDVKALRQALNDAKYTLRDPAIKAMESVGVTGDATNAKIAEGLKNLGANQKVIDYYTEAVDGKAPTISDYIRRSSLFEQAREMGSQIDAERYTRSASKAPANPMTRIWRASGLDQPIETILRNTIAPAAAKVTDLAGKAVEGTGNLVAGTSGKLPTIDVQTPTPEITPTSQSLYNIIGRTEGESQGNQARTAQYLANATNNANNSLESLATPNTMGDTSVYDSLYGTSMGTTQNTTVATNPYFQPTGDYWTDILANATAAAIDANDVSAFNSLYSMYQDALANTQKASSTSTTETKLTDKQRQANAAERALNDFENAQHNFAYDISDIPLIGNIANFGGNEYASKAEALALQIGYMLSGATVNKEEAKNIGMAYVPQPRDNEATRRSKLAQLRGIISDYQKTYSE